MNELNRLTLGFSPCPNDCFIFDALVHGKIDTEGLTFDVVMEDVEALNERAFRKDLHITKLSYHAFIYLTEFYQLLNSGSALGNGCGPLLIAKDELVKTKLVEGSSLKIAIPGKYTTANFLFSLAFPFIKFKKEVLFYEIEREILNGEVDAGVIIHENRFTYEEKGLKKIIDLGEYWEKLTQAPVPLGGIVMQRRLPYELKQKVNRVLRRSVVYAFKNLNESLPFVKAHAQEMSNEVMYKHIELYVNEFSIDLGEQGKRAINLFFEQAKTAGLITEIGDDLYI